MKITLIFSEGNDVIIEYDIFSNFNLISKEAISNINDVVDKESFRLNVAKKEIADYLNNIPLENLKPLLGRI